MDGRNPHLLIARIASAVIALGSIPAIALGNFVDTESQIVVFGPVESTHATSGSGWISIVIACAIAMLGVVLWLRRKPESNRGFIFGVFSSFFQRRSSAAWRAMARLKFLTAPLWPKDNR